MGRSVILQLVRDSIQEVYEAKNSIDMIKILQEHPLLNEKISTTVNLYLQNELRGSCSSSSKERSLIENLIIDAKKSAFEDSNFSPLKTSEYLEVEIEVILHTPEGTIQERDPSILETYNKNQNTN
jgi:AMMECR1 domain-containing protein